MNSDTVLAGTDGWITIVFSTNARSEMGVKSSAPRNGMSRNSASFIAWVLMGPNSSEYPSGRARATTVEPTLPEAPERFSTRTGWPRACRRWSATVRARMSVDPPGAQGTTMVTGRLG